MNQKRVAMPTNEKGYMQKYQHKKRLPQTFTKLVKNFTEFVKECKETFTEDVKNLPETFTEAVKESLPTFTEAVKNFTEFVKICEPAQTPAKPETIGSVDFCGQNSVTPRAMGGRGVGLDLNTVTGVHTNGTLPNNNDNSTVTLKPNQTKEKEDFLKNEKTQNAAEKRLPPAEYRIKQEEIFKFSYWAVYPKDGRLNFKTCFKIYTKIKRSLPTIERFCGVIGYYQDCVWEATKKDYIPMFEKFLVGENWKGLENKVMEDIENKLEYWKKVTQNRIAKYKGEQP
jgi:hypothetical protein